MNKIDKYAKELLEKLRSQPYAKEREEFGRMLMRDISTFTPKEMKRYNELKQILFND